MPILLIQLLTQTKLKTNILRMKQDSSSQCCRAISKGCFLFGMLTYASSSFGGGEVFAQGATPQSDDPQIINNLNVKLQS